MRYSIGVEKFKYSIKIKCVAVSRGVRGFTAKQTPLGEVAKWLNAADCKLVPLGAVFQIHPSPPYLIKYSCLDVAMRLNNETRTRYALSDSLDKNYYFRSLKIFIYATR